jgi:hypothetical protein
MSRTKEDKITNKAVYHHSLKFYDALAKQATEEKYGRKTLVVFRGKLVQVYGALGISQSYYQPIRKILEHNGCVEFLQSGSRGIDSVILLHKRPKNVDEFIVPPDLEKSPSKTLTDDPEFARLADKVEGLEILVGGIDIGTAIVELDRRLKTLGA